MRFQAAPYDQAPHFVTISARMFREEIGHGRAGAIQILAELSWADGD